MAIWWTPIPAKSFVNTAQGDLTLLVDYATVVQWEDVSGCPDPTGASVSLTLTCTPVGGGAPIVIGEQNYQVATPTTPGLQPSTPLAYVVPAGTLPLTTDYVCTIGGTCTVTFGGVGSGSGPFADTSSVETCIVRPSPLDANKPRLGVCCLRKDGQLISLAERGDQRASYYLISNNDPKETVTLDLESSGFQVANLPDGFSATDLEAAYLAGAASISNPNEGSDTFVGLFEEDIPANGIVPNPANPGSVDPLTITRRNVILEPLECQIVCVVTRSNGMCADGSCSRRTFKVTGTFSDGESALGCAASAHAVQSGESRQTPRCIYTDTIKAGPNDLILAGPGQIGSRTGPIQHANTHVGGNVPPSFQPIPGQNATEVRGANVPSSSGPFPQAKEDTITEEPFLVDSFFDISYEIVVQGAGFGGPGTQNRTTIFGIDQLQQGTPFDAPIIGLQSEVPTGPGFIVDSFFDVALDHAIVFDASGPEPQPLYDGPISQLQQFADGNPNVFLAQGSCRSISKSGDAGQKYSVLGPHKRTFVLGKKDRAEFFGADIPTTNGQDQQPSPWQAGRTGLGVQPMTANGNNEVPIELVALELQSVDPVQVDIFGKKNKVRDFHAWVDVSCPGGLNTVETPFLVRVVNDKGKPGIKAKGLKQPFKKVAVGATAQGMISIRNKGKGPVSFRLPDTLPAPFNWLTPMPGIHTLYPKREMMIGIEYTPVGDPDNANKNKGKDKAVVEIERSDKTKPMKLKLKGGWFKQP